MPKLITGLSMALDDAPYHLKHNEISEMYSWPQTFGDTSCGFGGIAGQAFTTAQIYMFVGPEQDVVFYIGGRFAGYRESLSREDMERCCGASMNLPLKPLKIDKGSK